MSCASTVFLPGCALSRLRYAHLVLDLFDLDEVSGIERKGRIIAVAFVRAEAAVRDALTPGIHRGRVPQLRKIPVVVAQIRNGIEDLATRYGAFIVNNRTGAARPALKLRTAFKSGLCDQFMHVDIDCSLEETRIARVVVLDRRVA